MRLRLHQHHYRRVLVLLEGSADSLVLRVWTKNLVLMTEVTTGPQPRGWTTVALPPAFSRLAPNGLYYLTVEAQRQGATARSKPVRLVILR